MKAVIDNAAGPTGAMGIVIGLFPCNPSEWLIMFSTVLVLIQISHWGYRFVKHLKRHKKDG